MASVDVETAKALVDLNHHWGSAYDIAHPADYVWTARSKSAKRGTAADVMLWAVTPDELREMIRKDYLTRRS